MAENEASVARGMRLVWPGNSMRLVWPGNDASVAGE